MPDQIWLDSWGLKLFGYVRLMREVIPHMIRQGGSRVELGMSAAEYEATCVKEIPMARLGGRKRWPISSSSWPRSARRT